MVIKNNAEFGVELALAVPYAYWLHEQGQLDTVITSKGMKPFYYFCNDVREEFTFRTIDNEAAGLNDLPNNWIHGDTKAGTVMTRPGVLDYKQWKLPPYKEYYKNDTFKFDKPTVFITNIFNHPDDSDIRHYHHIPLAGLYMIFSTLQEKGYNVIYKRENNKNSSITYDQNEHNSAQYANTDIIANVEGFGLMTDYELVSYFDNVQLLTDIVNAHSDMTFNEVQLKLLANCDKYISVCGGSAILSSCFAGTTVIYVTQGRELRPNYFSNDSYFHQLSKAKIIPVIDPVEEIKQRREHDISKIIKVINEQF
jgi:hypothetical protein